ncbi:MAG: hypothetical protein ABSA63_02915 [Thermoplasmata archaeon]
MVRPRGGRIVPRDSDLRLLAARAVSLGPIWSAGVAELAVPVAGEVAAG